MSFELSLANSKLITQNLELGEAPDPCKAMTVRKHPALVVFQGGAAASSPLEGLVAQGQAAATLDLLAAAASTGAFDRAILVTELDALAGVAASEVRAAGDLPVPVEKLTAPSQAGAAFHFGESLLRVCQ